MGWELQEQCLHGFYGSPKIPALRARVQILQNAKMWIMTERNFLKGERLNGMNRCESGSQNIKRFGLSNIIIWPTREKYLAEEWFSVCVGPEPSEHRPHLGIVRNADLGAPPQIY